MLIKENKNALHHYFSAYDQVWEKLSTKLNRSPYSIYERWERVMKPHILMFEHGLENVDFRPILVDYCVDNNIVFRNETNWREIAKDARFRGTTAHYLLDLYRDLLKTVKRTNPGLKDYEVTSEKLQNYLATRAKNRKLSKKYKKLHEDFLKIRNAFQ